MPIHLPPLSRRRFLVGTALGGTFLTWRTAWGDEPGVDPHRWALISDTHIDQKRDTLKGKVNMATNLEQVVGQITGLEQRPAGVLHCGDAAYLAGESGDYATLGELLKPLAAAKIATHIALGNHDHRERFWQALAEHKSAPAPVAARHLSVVTGERANWFVLDSLDKTNVVAGVLGKEQLTWLSEALDKHADKPALIMVHHNPFAGPPPKPAPAKTAPATIAPEKTPAEKAPAEKTSPAKTDPAKTAAAIIQASFAVAEPPAKTDAKPAAPAPAPATKPPGGLTSATAGLTDIADLLALLIPRRHVKALLFGHTHHWEHGKHEGIHLLNLPPTAYAFNTADPSGWVDVHLRADGATFELRSLDTAHKSHGQKLDWTWR